MLRPAIVIVSPELTMKSLANHATISPAATTSASSVALLLKAGLRSVVAASVGSTRVPQSVSVRAASAGSGQRGETMSQKQKQMPSQKVELERIAVIGSGNWGSVAAKIVASNAISHGCFHDEVRMFVHEEVLENGAKLTEVINEKKENVKYLPNVNLGYNVVADPDMGSAVKDATLLVFCTPHQFVDSIFDLLKGNVNPNAKAISLIKGMEVKPDGPVMMSKLITENLGLDCSVLMGANIANEVAMEEFSESTVGYRSDKSIADTWVRAFHTPYFRVAAVQDVEGVELCGTLKNVVAIAAGFVDGLGMGSNTKAAIIRIGLKEMMEFSKLLYPTVRDTTFFESCGVADLITTCYAGRNRKVAEAFARSGGKRTFDELEAELLDGQKLQGVLTAGEVFQVMRARNWEDKFPLFTTVHKIASGLLPPSAIIEYDHKHSTEVCPA